MIKFLYIDLFCGAGGTSTGVENARLAGQQFAKVIACVNHDANAIASHAANHPDALHFVEDIRTLELTSMIAHTSAMRKLHPDAKVVLWASLECTNFSIAKGGQSRDADSRTLAEHLYRYIEVLMPDYIQIENVKEFKTWGPLIVKVVEDKKMGTQYCPLSIKSEGTGKSKRRTVAPVMVPDPARKGEYYRQWVTNVKGYGYRFNERELDAADFGAYTSRKRFFGIFAAGTLPIVFPEPTHTKNPSPSLFDQRAKWRPVRDVLDLADEGVSIFGRKKPLADATHERIYAGLVKFVAGGKDAFMVKYNSVNYKTGNHIPPGIDEPCPVVAAQDRLGLAKACFLSRYNSVDPTHTAVSVDGPCGALTTENRFATVNVNFIQQRNTGNPESKIVSVDRPARTVTATGGNQDIVTASFLAKHFSGHPESKSISIDGPAHAITGVDHHSLVNAYFLTKYYSGMPEHKCQSIEKPAGTVRTKDCFSLIRPEFLTAYYGRGFNTSVEAPAPTVTTSDRFAVVRPRFLDMQYGTSRGASIEAPDGTVTTTPKHHLVTCHPWIYNPHFQNGGNSLDQPFPTVTANRKWHYLMNPQYKSTGGSIETPCFTLIVRMDKMPPYLITPDHDGATMPSFIHKEGNALIYEIYSDDTPIMVQIKEFMALYGLVDIKMRMLKIPELKRIMGFPANYKLIGTQAEQKKYIGNAVEVTMARVLCEALGAALVEYLQNVA